MVIAAFIASEKLSKNLSMRYPRLCAYVLLTFYHIRILWVTIIISVKYSMRRGLDVLTLACMDKTKFVLTFAKMTIAAYYYILVGRHVNCNIKSVV